MASEAAIEKQTRGWLAQVAVPILLTVVAGLFGIALSLVASAWNELKTLRAEDMVGLALQRVDDRVDVAVLAGNVRDLDELVRTNQIIMTQLQVLIGVLADDTADLEIQVRVLQNWQRAVLNAQ